jgi:putative membrane protein
VTVVADTLVALVALIHVYILVLEMFLWTSPRGRRAFGTEPEFAQASRALAGNQGLYNGFLAAGLVWGLIAGGSTGFGARVFFLVCVAIAGLYGALTASRRILFVQTVPALVALAFVLAAH